MGNKYSKISKQLIDFLVITYADSLVSLRRDYTSSLALEKRSFLNQENIDQYNSCLNSLQGLFADSIDSYILLDTSNIGIKDVSTEVTSQILSTMRKKYIKDFKKKYDLK